MSVSQTQVVDSISSTRDGSEIVLPLYDHLDWVTDQKEHMYLLQEKVKNYLEFVARGQLIELNPQYAGKPATILIVAKHQVPEDKLVKDFFDYLDKLVSDEGLKLRLEVYPVD